MDFEDSALLSLGTLMECTLDNLILLVLVRAGGEIASITYFGLARLGSPKVLDLVGNVKILRFWSLLFL